MCASLQSTDPDVLFFAADCGSTFTHFYSDESGKRYKVGLIALLLLKVIEIGTTRNSIRDFLLVFHCNYIHIFYRYYNDFRCFTNHSLV